MAENKADFKAVIMSKISKGEVKMHSRDFFVGQILVWSAVILLTVLVGILVSSFLIFSLKASGRLFLPAAGLHGWQVFLTSFPWLILLLAVILVLVLEILVRRFAYRRPFIYLLGGLLLVVFFGGALVANTSVHPYLSQQAHEHGWPVADDLYQRFGKADSDADIYRGVVADLTSEQFTLKFDHTQCTVKPASAGQLQGLANGDDVFVFGTESDGNFINASQINRVSDDRFYQELRRFDGDFDLK